MFFDDFTSFQLRLFIRLLGLADRRGKVETRKRALARKMAWIKEPDGSVVEARTMDVHRALNYFAAEGIIKKNYAVRTPRTKDQEYRVPIIIERKYFVLARIDQHAETALRDRVERLETKTATLSERNTALRENNKELRAYRDLAVRRVAETQDPLDYLGGSTKNGYRIKVIIAWLVVIGVDEFFYDPDNHAHTEQGLQPTYSLFNKWISIAGSFSTAVAVLESLSPYNVKGKICVPKDTWIKNRDRIRAYITGAIKKGKAQGISSRKRYGRSGRDTEDGD